MQTVLLVFHIILAIAMIAVVLLQKSDGGALMSSGGSGGGFMSVRGTANLLTRTTAVLATLFFAMTLALAILFKGEQTHTSLIDEASLQQQQTEVMKKQQAEEALKTIDPATPNKKAAVESQSDMIKNKQGVPSAQGAGTDTKSAPQNDKKEKK